MRRRLLLLWLEVQPDMTEHDFFEHIVSVRRTKVVKSAEKKTLSSSEYFHFACHYGALPYIRVHVWRSQWLVSDQWSAGCCHLDQFCTELPAFNMLLLMVCISHFSSHTSDQQVFFPVCFAQQLLVDKPPPLPPQVKLHLNSWLLELNQLADNINHSLTTIISQPYTYAYSAARAPGAKPDRQNPPLASIINVYKSWGSINRGDHQPNFEICSTWSQVCDARGRCKWGCEGAVCLPWPQLSVAAGQLPACKFDPSQTSRPEGHPRCPEGPLNF